MEKEHRLIKERRKKIQDLQKIGVNVYPYRFEKTHNSIDVLEKFKKVKPNKHTGKKVTVAGRIVSMRGMGKVAFFHIQDTYGKIQIHIRKDDIKDQYKIFKKTDIGDYVGITGEVFATKTGEISVLTEKYTLLSKSLLPLPDKYHGLKDPELRYRKRYLDLIMNPDEKKRFITRSKIVNYVREFLNDLDFLEVETPVLQVLYGGTNAKPFTTHINAYNMQMYLRVAPELYLKRLVVGGFDRVYEIARNFRNEGVDQTHNPEFTMIEWYEAYADYNLMMDRAEGMYKFIAKKLFGKEQITVHGKKINISNKWPRLPLKKAIKKYVKLDVDKMSDKELKQVLKKHKIEIAGKANRGVMIFTIFDKLVCDYLQKPIWIIDYPKEVSPLSKQHRKDPALVERFECYIGGKEIGDGWSEIINPIDQRDRFEKEQAAMRAGNDEAHPMDEDFIESMEYGMPPLGGIGVGIDRLVMLFTDHWSIRDVIFFPIMKPRSDNAEKEDEVNISKDIKGLPTRKQALDLLKKHVKDKYQVMHAKMVAHVMEKYAEKYKENKDLWYITGLLHDLDFYEHPDEHPDVELAMFKKLKYPEQLIHAIAAHYHKKTKELPKTKLAKALLAIDELTGLLHAYSLMRPDGYKGMKPKSFKKKFKDKSFAAKVDREDISYGIEKLGVDFNEHITFVVEALIEFKNK